MLLVQEYLKTHSFGDLVREHGVYASFSKSGHKFSLNYDQIEAKEADPLAQECRGLVLAREDGASMHPFPEGSRGPHEDYSPGATTILAYPMKRFFNHGQGSAAQINWSDPKLAVLEKLDGTLCIVYYDKFSKAWCVATRSVPEADLPMDNGLFTFRTLFEKALKDTCGLDFGDFTKGLNTHITYCFELTTPYNRIVVSYPESRVTLLAARQMHGNYEEFDLDNLGGGMKWVPWDKLDQKTIDHLVSLGHNKEDTPEAFIHVPFNLSGVPIVQAHTYTSVEELVNWVSSLNPLEHEGVVVRDSNFNRIKVKNAAYVAYNKLHDRLGSSERNLMEFILLETDDDILSALAPEIGVNMTKLKAGLQNVISNHDEWYRKVRVYMELSQLSDKKSFALSIGELNKIHGAKVWSAPLFQMWDGKASSMKDFIMNNKKDGTWSDSFIDRLLDLAKLHT